jgi:hypothetical protein
MKHRRKFTRCRRGADWTRAAALAVALAGCGDADRSEPVAGEPVVVEATSDAAAAPQQSRWSERYYEGYLAETMEADVEAARAAYLEVLAGAADEEPDSAARAALRLAELELLAGNRRKAQELVARASVLGRDSPEILERADRAQARTAALRSQSSEVRGPPAKTELEGEDPTTVQLFRRAEGLLAAYHGRRLQPRLEGVRSGIRQKESAREQAERVYHQVIEAGAREAKVASEFRIGSLHHDLALALMFDVPPELEEREAAKLRRSLRSRALGHLRKARAAYERSLEAAGTGREVASTERWRLAAEVGLRAVKDLLSGRE